MLLGGVIARCWISDGRKASNQGLPTLRLRSGRTKHHRQFWVSAVPLAIPAGFCPWVSAPQNLLRPDERRLFAEPAIDRAPAGILVVNRRTRSGRRRAPPRTIPYAARAWRHRAGFRLDLGFGHDTNIQPLLGSAQTAKQQSRLKKPAAQKRGSQFFWNLAS